MSGRPSWCSPRYHAWPAPPLRQQIGQKQACILYINHIANPIIPRKEHILHYPSKVFFWFLRLRDRSLVVNCKTSISPFIITILSLPGDIPCQGCLSISVTRWAISFIFPVHPFRLVLSHFIGLCSNKLHTSSTVRSPLCSIPPRQYEYIALFTHHFPDKFKGLVYLRFKFLLFAVA